MPKSGRYTGRGGNVVMKHTVVKIAAALLIAGAPGLASAQTVPGGSFTDGITGGIKGGITFANIPDFAEVLDDDGAETSMRMGFVVGGFATKMFDDIFGLQVEGLYTQKGLKYTFDPDEFEYRLDYIDIPVLLRMQPSRTTGLYALVGPAFSFNINAEAFSEFADEEETVDIGDEVTKFEMSLVAAVGVQVQQFLIVGRYMEGLTNLLDDPPADVSYKNRTFAILAGIRF